MTVVAKGRANIVVQGPDNTVYRLCVRYADCLQENNEYTAQNAKYISDVVSPLLEGYVATMQYLILPIAMFKEDYSLYVKNLDDTGTIHVLQMQNLKSSVLKIAFQSHFTKCFIDQNGQKQVFLMEFKPKWLFDELDYCRNCTHNLLKNVKDKLCYKLIRKDPKLLADILSDTVPQFWLTRVIEYFEAPFNILDVVYKAQKTAFSRRDTPLLMTLRDLTCFIEINQKNNFLPRVNIIDVDYKPAEKKNYWDQTQHKLDSMNNKVYHSKNDEK